MPNYYKRGAVDLDAAGGGASAGGARSGVGPAAYLPGRYYTSGVLNLPAFSAAVTAGKIYLTPIHITQNITINALACRLTAIGTAGHVARMAIYASGDNGLPTTKLVEASTPVSPAAVKIEPVAADLVAGLYYIAFAAQSGSYYGTNDARIGAAFGYNEPGGNLDTHLQYAFPAGVTAADPLPNTMGAVTPTISSTLLTWFRVA